MKPEIEVEIEGKKYALSLPLGGLEEIAKVNPQIEEVWQALLLGVYRLDELVAVLEAGLKWGDCDLEASDVIERIGLRPAARIAADLMAAAVRDDAPKKKETDRKKSRKRGS